MVMMMMNLARSLLLLGILLDRCEILLRSRDVSVLQVRRKGSERLSDRVRIGSRSRGGCRGCGSRSCIRRPGLRRREVLRQRRVILLRLS